MCGVSAPRPARRVGHHRHTARERAHVAGHVVGLHASHLLVAAVWRHAQGSNRALRHEAQNPSLNLSPNSRHQGRASFSLVHAVGSRLARTLGVSHHMRVSGMGQPCRTHRHACWGTACALQKPASGGTTGNRASGASGRQGMPAFWRCAGRRPCRSSCIAFVVLHQLRKTPNPATQPDPPRRAGYRHR